MFLIGTVVIALGIYVISRVISQRKDIYKGKNALVIGGCSGLGLALAKDLKKRGAKVTVTSRKKSTIKEYTKKYGFTGVQVDVTQDLSVEGLSPEYDLIFCCPGLAIPCLAKDLTIEKIQTCMETNFYGTVRVVLHYLKTASSNRKKRLVMISSTLGLHSFIGYGAYSPSKASLKSFYESIQMEASAEGLDLSIYFCSTINTPGLVQEEKTKPEITKQIEGRTHSRASLPENRARVLLEALPHQNIIVSDVITQFFSQSTDILSISDYFVWRISPVFWYFFNRSVSYHFKHLYTSNKTNK